MAPDENQQTVDAAEERAAASFRRGQRVSAVVAEAIRRDEALQRLELSLKLQPDRRR